MFPITILVSFVLSVNGMQTSHHQVFISRKLRSNSEPISSGYVYRVYNHEPASLSNYGYSGSNEDASSETLEKFNSPSDLKRPYMQYSAPIGGIETVVNNHFTEPPSSNFGQDYEIAKAESKYNSRFLPSKMETDAMYERLKSVMHYHPPVESENIGSYEHSDEYNFDDDDVRSSSRSVYSGWPHYYRSPYEYEQMKIDSEIEKAKDKRYAVDNARVIPVHEDLDGDPLNTYGALSTMRYSRDTATDNPISGDQPFLSFVLNDYYSGNIDDDTLVFKGPHWGKEFDQGSPVPYLDEYLKRQRRLENNESEWKEVPHYNDGTLDSLLRSPNDGTKVLKGETSKIKLHDKKHEYDYRGNGNQGSENNKNRYEHKGSKYNGFKDFVDNFAKMFGSTDNKKDSKYTIKKNLDKGEKKKGFRRVYHKNEYQEEDEFYDNNNSTANAEETGKSNGNMSATEAFIRSHSTAAIDNEAKAFNNKGDSENNRYVKDHKRLEHIKGRDKTFNEYRDVAKKAAQSNNADYIDHFRI